jgi:uncharacterized protein
MSFYGRKKELDAISAWFRAAEKGALFTAIIGRRRIGKTRLWIESAEAREDSLYLFCLPGTFDKTLEQVEDQLYSLGFTSIPDAMDEFFKAAELILRKGRPLTFFFDEVQNLFLDSRDDLILFQKYIDDFKRKKYPCLVVFCGSAKTLLHQMLYDDRSPLYGRLDQVMHLEALPFAVIRELLRDHDVSSPADQLRLYTMFGSNPRFYEILIQFDLIKAGTRSLLERGWLGMTGLFSDELNKMLLPELKKYSHVYAGILKALARSIHDATEIASIAGVTTTSLGNYMPFLIETLDLVRKEIPATEKANSKITRYRIKDPFILFWYRYMERNRALLELGQTRQVMSKIEDDLPNLEGTVLEMVAREKILADPPMAFDVAGPVFRNRRQIEIDFLLADEKTNRIHVYEVKRGKVDRLAIEHRLIARAAQLDFKSVRLRDPDITAEVITLYDV